MDSTAKSRIVTMRSKQLLYITEEYNAILQNGVTRGAVLPSLEQQAKQNLFLATLKALGIWPLLDTLYVFLTDGDNVYARINWKNPLTFYYAPGGGSVLPTFTPNNGFKGNGVNMSLRNFWRPSLDGVNFNSTSAGLGGDFSERTTPTSNQFEMGAWDGSFNQVGLNMLNNASFLDGTIFDAFNSNPSVAPGSGFIHIKRTGSVFDSTQSAWRDGNFLKATFRSQDLATVNRYLDLLARPAFGGGDPAAGFSESRVKMCWTGSALTGNELNFYNAWNTYKSSL